LFIIVPEFSMMPYTAAIEALRAANRESGADLYHWQTVSIDGTPVAASNRTQIAPDCALAAADPAHAEADVLALKPLRAGEPVSAANVELVPRRRARVAAARRSGPAGDRPPVVGLGLVAH
jgi:transcriptional regulator GlxA family with amidase domain